MFAVAALALLGFLVAADKPWTLEPFEDRKVSTRDYRTAGLWWGALASFGAMLLGILATPWTGQSNATPAGKKTAVVLGSIRKQAWTGRTFLMLALVLTAAAVLRAPRLNHSFWNDEEWAFRKYTWGEARAEPSSDPTLKATTWERALFANSTGNNHLWHTLEARLSMAGARAVGVWPDNETEFREWVPRLMPFLSGLATIAAMAWLGTLLGGVRLGLMTAAVLALSPWHLRYAVEARGYASMLLFIVLGLGCLVRALQTNRWRWWLGFLASQAAMLLAFLGSLPLVLVAGLVVPVSAWRRFGMSGAVRYLCAGFLTSVPVLLLLGPSIPQVLAYLARDDGHTIPGIWPLVRDLGSHLVLGIPWHSLREGGALGIGVLDLGAITKVGLVAALVTAGAGVVRLLGVREARVPVLIVLLGPALLFCQSMLGESPLHGWYLLPLLIAFCLGLSTVFTAASGRVSVGLLVLLTTLVWRPLERIAKVPRQPMREAVALAHQIEPEALHAVFGISDRQLRSYDPGAILLQNAEDLADAEALAESRGIPLLVLASGKVASRQKRPEIGEQIEDATQFEEIGFIPGFEAMFSYTIWRRRFAP